MPRYLITFELDLNTDFEGSQDPAQWIPSHMEQCLRGSESITNYRQEVLPEKDQQKELPTS